MDVVHGWKDVPSHLQGASLAVGTFDGIHRGHQAVLDAAKAASGSGLVGAMMFEPYPRRYFQPGKPFFRLTSLQRKLTLLDGTGCDFAAVLPFDGTLAQMSAEDFVRIVLVDGYAIRHASVGFNFFFGKNRAGTALILRELGAAFGFGVTILEPQGGAGEIFSSTRIRELLAEGDVAAAAESLGHYWRVAGVVESGAGRGTGLGFPTANIRLEEGTMLRHGIYAVRVHLSDRVVNGASYLGTRPTFDSGAPLLETFLFDFDANLYGQTIEIEFVAFIREDAKFRSTEALSSQMAIDCARAQAVLAAFE